MPIFGGHYYFVIKRVRAFQPKNVLFQLQKVQQRALPNPLVSNQQYVLFAYFWPHQQNKYYGAIEIKKGESDSSERNPTKPNQGSSIEGCMQNNLIKCNQMKYAH